MGGRSATTAFGIAILGASREQGQRISIETTLPRIAYFGFVVPDEVDPRALWLVPSNLGDQLARAQEPNATR